MTDGEVVDLCRRLRSLQLQTQEIIEAIADNDHPNAHELSEAL